MIDGPASLILGSGNLATIFRFIIIMTGVILTYLKSRSAAKLSEPTGNGYAEEMKATVARIETKLDAHIGDHAAADVAAKRERDRRLW